MNKIISLFAFLFICWIIVCANWGLENSFVNFAHSIPYGDKIGHFFIFGLLTFTFNKTLNYKTFKCFKMPFLWGSLLVLSFALIEEFSQIAFELRTFDWRDMLCDLLGVICFSLPYYYNKNTKAKTL